MGERKRKDTPTRGWQWTKRATEGGSIGVRMSAETISRLLRIAEAVGFGATLSGVAREAIGRGLEVLEKERAK